MVELSPRVLVGRAPGCDLVVDDLRTSREHAVIAWDGRGWSVRDLGSRNGTWVDDRRLTGGEVAPLRAGAHLGIGDEATTLQLLCDAPPSPMAETDEGDVVRGAEGLLLLPDGDGEVAVYWSDAGWMVDDGGPPRPAADGAALRAGGRRYVLRLPAAPTTTAPKGAPRVADLTFEFRVSLDEEHVEVVAWHGKRVLDLGTRAHHDLLLLLARARLTDQGRADLPASARGWRYHDEVATALNADDGAIYLAVHRARRQLADHGIANPTALVERRRRPRQLRLGTGRLAVRRV